MNDKAVLESINSKLEILINLLAEQVVGDINTTEAIVKLGRLGLDRKTIAKVLSTTPAIVSVRMSEAKPNPKKKAKKI